MSELCPCCSGKSYSECCEIFHNGVIAPDALTLMRSRYSAYAKKKLDYIIRTTHPENNKFQQDQANWRKEILYFYGNTVFERLEIVNFTPHEDKNEAYVTFIAHLKQNSHDASFREKSYFKKKDGHWLYHSGTIERIV